MPPRFIDPDAKHRVILSEDFSQEDRRQTIVDMVNMLAEKGCTWWRLDAREDGRVMVMSGWKNRPRLPDLEARIDPSDFDIPKVPA
jgi:hypothetical protein